MAQRFIFLIGSIDFFSHLLMLVLSFINLFLICVFLIISMIGESEGGQDRPLTWNSCRHYCVYGVRTTN